MSRTAAETVILASASPVRRRLLENAGFGTEVRPARIDEDAIRAGLEQQGAGARDVADVLAEQKARRVSARRPGALVIGADQVLEIEGEILTKPGGTEAARAQLRRLRGRTHRLFSAAVICRDGQPQWRHVGVARLTMRDFSDAFLEDYLAEAGASIHGCVGCYQLEAVGIRLFSRVEGDYFTVLGLPLIELTNHLYQSGFLKP